MRETELLEIAKEVIRLNPDISAKLSGSLMLYHLGVRKNREATDIDIICEYLCEDREADGFPIVPKGFKLSEMDGSRSQVEAIQFINDDGIKIDFMASNEHGTIEEEIPCADITNLIHAKLYYVIHDNNEDSKSKHLQDLEFIFSHNKIAIL